MEEGVMQEFLKRNKATKYVNECELLVWNQHFGSVIKVP